MTGRDALDVGASTGGFTDCLLQRGAARVTAVDVGYGQLDWRLRNDPRVRVMERVNFRLLADDAFPEGFDVIAIDASFISLRTILARAAAYLRDGGVVVALVKPQFEAGRSRLGGGGVVRDRASTATCCARCAPPPAVSASSPCPSPRRRCAGRPATASF